MKRKILITLFSLGLLLLLGSVEQILACMCGKSETCERFNYSEAIFIGKVVAVEKGNSGIFETESTIFEVQESFLGEQKKQIKVQNKMGFSCDISFPIGETFLVFAGELEDKTLGTNFCAGNLPIKFAGEEIENLRRLIKSNKDGKLFGSIAERLQKRDKKNEFQPISDVKVQIREIESGKIYSTITDQNGNYEVAVPAGKYKVLPVLPDHAELDYKDERETVSVKKNGGCSQQYFSLKNKSKLSGRLLDDQGNPLSNVRVELSAADLTDKTWRGSDYLLKTDQNGAFAVDNVPSGKYILSFNYFDFPDSTRPFATSFYRASESFSSAQILTVGLGENIENIEFRLSKRLSEKEITGSIYWPDGSPAKDVNYFLEDSAYTNIFVGCIISALQVTNSASRVLDELKDVRTLPKNCDLRTDSEGRFKISGFSGRKYRIKAETTKVVNGQKINYFAESELFSADEHPNELKLILKEKEKEQ